MAPPYPSSSPAAPLGSPARHTPRGGYGLRIQLDLMIEGQEGVTWPQWLAIARACGQHGIATLFRSGHYMDLSGQHPERGSLDALGTTIALAAQTTTLRLGTMVSPASFRHPSVLCHQSRSAARTDSS
jgi:alkanesulfonate monooxygenase SsuD/methylene tetrahydromethanopterin reductase-like flavin-dependent oxidoreductase (luciferase family)